MGNETRASGRSGLELNIRGEYPPIEILQRCRRALSASANASGRNTILSEATLNDLLTAYNYVLEAEIVIRKRHGLPPIKTVPSWAKWAYPHNVE